jgi:hypothetical protein
MKIIKQKDLNIFLVEQVAIIKKIYDMIYIWLLTLSLILIFTFATCLYLVAK